MQLKRSTTLKSNAVRRWIGGAIHDTLVACLLVGLTLAATLAVGQEAGSRHAEPKTLPLGAPAPDFDLPGVDGQRYALKDFAAAKVLVVVFTCNHCPTAQAYEQRIIDLQRDYGDKGVALVAISPNDPLAVRLDELGYSDVGDSLGEMKLRAHQRDFKFPYLYDGETQHASAAYGVLATPHVYIFDAERHLQYVGRIDDNEVKPPTSHDARNAIDQLLASKPVAVPQTRVFGCSTKWADKRQSAVESLAKWNEESAELSVISPADLHQQLTGKSDNYRLVNVWATWCIPCVEELDELVTMHRMYRGREFELITVCADDVANKDKAIKVLSDKHCSARNFILQASTQDELFDSVDPQWQGAVPYTMLVSPSGKVVHRVHGELEPLELKRVIVEHIGRTYAPR